MKAGLWIFFFLGGMCSAQTNTAITGAWGFKLGQIVNASDTNHFLAVSKHNYVFRPRTLYRKFTTYAISVTTEHEIALISASGKFTNHPEFDAEKRAVAAITATKFGSASNDDTQESRDLSELIFRKVGRQVTFKAKYPEIELYIQDDALSLTLAKEMLTGK